MGDVTIPRIMTENQDDVNLHFTVKRSSNRKAQSKVQVILVCVCYFLQKNCKTNEFIVLQEAKRRSHETMHLAKYHCMRTTSLSSAIKRVICSK